MSSTKVDVRPVNIFEMKLHTPAELSAKSGTMYKNPTNLLDRNQTSEDTVSDTHNVPIDLFSREKHSTDIKL